MNVASVKITKNNIGKVRAEVANKIPKALEQCGLIGESYASLLSPVDTGRLRDSITHKVEAQGTRGTVYVGTNVEYSTYVEMGARGRAPKPYIRPAIKGHIGEYQTVIVNTLKG